MKTAPQRLAWLAVLTLLVWMPRASAVPTVKTLSGGPKSFNLNNYGYRDGQTFSNAQFNFPGGMAINTLGTIMYVADRTNNAVRAIGLPAEAVASQTTTFPPTNLYVTNRISRPIDILTDGGDNVYVLNRGSATNTLGVATNGSVVKFNQYGNFLGTLVQGLTNAMSFAIDGSTNLYIVNATNQVMKIPGYTNAVSYPSASNLAATVVNAGTRLSGIAVMADGRLALADANPVNSGIWLVDPITNHVDSFKTPLTGFHGTFEVFGTSDFASLNEPERIARAGGGFLVVSDRKNHRVKVVTPNGTVTNLYGVASNIWIVVAGSSAVKPGWMDGPGVAYPTVDQARAEAREPFGVCVSGAGEVYVSEVYYHLIRKASTTGLSGPGGVNNGGGPSTVAGSTNTTVPEAPIISPTVGYYPMGQSIKITSAPGNLYYTVDGSEPTTNSPYVVSSSGTTYLNWNQPQRDLSGLRIRAFDVNGNGGTNAAGTSPTSNTVWVPNGRYPTILAGVGSTIIVPVVATLRPSDAVKSYQFRVELTPGAGAPPITNGFDAMSVTTNELISVVTAAQGASGGSYSVTPYNIGTIGGLAISAISSQSGVSFKNFAVVAKLKIPIPPDAQVGQTYTIQVVSPSATSDAQQTPVQFNAGAATTISIINKPYVVGDAATASWYNAGDFGDGNLANNDINTIFDASLGLRLPDSFSDIFDAMDAFPEDATGFVGGDGQIRFLDWQLTLDRALRLETNNWVRAWDSGGFHSNDNTILVVPTLQRLVTPPPGQVWYRQAVVGGARGAYGLPGSTVEIPVFAKVVAGANLAGMQFRAVATPDGSAPALTLPVQFVPAPTMPTPSTASYDNSQIGCGWPLNSMNFAGSSSNYLGKLVITIPSGAQVGQTYTVAFANADGSPDIHTQYDFETRRVKIAVGYAAPAAPDQISDEWKASFFGSLTSPLADPNADPDGDGSSNFEEFLNGTNPTNGLSRLRLNPGAVAVVNKAKQLPLQWLSAPGKVYAVERSASPASGVWTTLGTYMGDGNNQQFLETNLNSSAQFYRVRVISAP